MITLEEYQLQYELYLAEQEMIDSLVSLTSLVSESAGIIYIQETVKETLMRYMSRIAQSISQTYTKFTTELHKKMNDPFLKKFYKNRIETGFNVTNFPTYNLEKLDQVKVLNFDYERMKDKLESKPDFVKAFYQILSNPENIKESMKALSVLSRKDTTIDRRMIDEMYEFCTSKYEKRITTMQADFDMINKSNKEIEQLVSNVMATNEMVSIMESILLEEDKPQETPKPVPAQNPTSSTNDKKENEKIGFKDDAEKKRVEKEARAKITKVVTNYTAISTEIIVQKMNCIKDCFNTYMKILRHASTSEEKEKEENNQVEVEKKNDTQIHY